MRRVAVIIGLCALLLPMAAWASGIDLTNNFGTVTISNTGIVSAGSQLVSFNKISLGHTMGYVNFSTGAFTGASIWTGGTFAGGAGSSFVVTGVGAWTKTLAGSPQGPVTLFSGNFVGPVNWTVLSVGKGGFTYAFELSGTIQGQLWDGRTVSGTTKQLIYVYKNQWMHDGKGGISLSSSNVAVPEPGTLGLLGAGLIGIAGTMRRKLFGA